MKNMKKRNGGFTLVELIIVIAILAILAAIAIPAYSGYIKKANQAADEMLLGAVNTAFAASCIENGISPKGVSGAAMPLTGSEGSMQVNTGSVGPAEIKDSFAKYFAGNEGATFKYFTYLSYDSANGVFVGGEVTHTTAVVDGVTHHYYTTADGVTYDITQDQLDAFNASTYGTNMSITELMGDVTGMVDSLTTALNSGDTLASILGDPEAFGVTADPDEDPETYKNQLANATVLLVAQNTTADTASSIIDAINSGELNSLMSTENGFGPLLGNMAGLYGIATGFASSDAAADWSMTIDGTTYNASEYYQYVNSQIAAAAASNVSMGQKVKDITNAMGLLTAYVYNDPTDTSSGLTAAFTTYAAGGESSQLTNDANGYVNALQAIATNSDALISSGAIQNGFDSSTITAILSAVFGI
jgi:prepilin-type N-terminal cleavage/methylation domain-containing protein